MDDQHEAQQGEAAGAGPSSPISIQRPMSPQREGASAQQHVTSHEEQSQAADNDQSHVGAATQGEALDTQDDIEIGQDNANAESQLPQQPGAHSNVASTQTRPTGFAALVDRFVSNFRNTIERQNDGSDAPQDGQDGEAQPHTNAQVGEALATAATNTFGTENAETQNTSSEDAQPAEGETRTDNRTTNEPPARPQMLVFRMPIVDAQGNPATIGFMPGPIPVAEEGAVPPTFGPDRPPHLGADRGNGRASGYHLPESPIFVPLGTSPLPFSFLFDAQTNTAWPILNMSQGPPGAMPPEAPGPNAPRFISGPPFRIALNFHFVPPPAPEQPDEERAKRFVASLERADAELRGRLARLGMGDIGIETGQDAIGCGICLEEYPTEDRPEWIGGQASVDEEVVAVPCGGHHTLHHSCLYGWLAQTPPSQWSCPFCRAKLDKAKVADSALPEQRAPQASPMQRADSADKKSQDVLKPRTLREEVRFRERMHGWRCDSPACLPRYPDLSDVTNDSTEASVCPERGELVTLLPCHHKIHLECLCTSMKLEQAVTGSPSPDADLEDEDEDGEDEAEDEAGKGADGAAQPAHRRLSSSRQTVGKWVTCPTCRHEAWAELPVRRRPKRAESARAQAIQEEAVIEEKIQSSLDDADAPDTKFAPELNGIGQTSGAREEARLRDIKAQVAHDYNLLAVPGTGQSTPHHRRSEDSNAARSDADVEAMLS